MQFAAFAGLDPASAQTSGILANGNAIVTGFSGAPQPAQIAPGQDPGDLTFIDPNGPSARVFNLQSPGAPPQAQVIPAPNPFTVTAAQVGQVFGVTIDNATPPNMYVAASSAYGLPIVVPGANGAPTRLHQGAPGATFMAGLFGPPAQGGGPGSIWRIDGTTGAVTLFANVTLNGAPNSGPALGGLAFDPASQTIIVADRQTGMIQSYNLSGTQVGTYDHGVTGLAAAGQTQVPYTPTALDITNPAFSSDNPATWDYAPAARLIFGLGVQNGRLYYGVAAGLQVWSVSINSDGTFGSDARMEVQVPAAAGPTEISKITFDGSGDMIVAERGTPTGDYELMAVAQPAVAPVLQYVPATPVTPASLQTPPSQTTPTSWQSPPNQYAIGFPGQYTNANGGIALGYNYTPSGALDPNSCGGFLWSTGEQLRNSGDPNIAGQLAAGGTLDLNGLQGNALSLVEPANVPPFLTYFVDYDAALDDPAAAGHMGDIAIPIKCRQAAPSGYCPPWQTTPFGHCCPPWQEVVNGACMCPGGLQPGQGGQCSCQAGYSQQPGYLCCPIGTLPGPGGCQTTCPHGESDQASEILCWQGFNPHADSSGNLTCLDGSSPNPPYNIYKKNSAAASNACLSASLLTNPANCPVGWTMQTYTTGSKGSRPVCAPPPQCAGSTGGPAQLVNGTCQNLCGSQGGGLAYLTTQCCRIGTTAGSNGLCPPPPPTTCPTGSTYQCPPVAPVGNSCDNDDRVPGGCCPSGSKPNKDGYCIPTSCTGGGTCCSANVVVNFHTYPPSCCKAGEILLISNKCGPPPPPPSCKKGDTVYCKPTPASDSGCGTGTPIPGTSLCCAKGTKVSGGNCVATGKSCPKGDEERCCSRYETPVFVKGKIKCCKPGYRPNSDGVCVRQPVAAVVPVPSPTPPPPPTPPSSPPGCERPGTTPFCQPLLNVGGCAPGQGLVAGAGCCPAGSSPNQTLTGCLANGPTCGTGSSVTAPLCCPATTPLQANGLCGTPSVVPTCTPPYVYNPDTKTCVRTSTTPVVPVTPPTGVPVLVQSCNGGSFVNGVCTCPRTQINNNGTCGCPAGYSERDGVCSPPPKVTACPDGEVHTPPPDGPCKCPAGEAVKDGVCQKSGGSTGSCANGKMVGNRCECDPGYKLSGTNCVKSSSSGGSTGSCANGRLIRNHCECDPGYKLSGTNCVKSTSTPAPKTTKPPIIRRKVTTPKKTTKPPPKPKKPPPKR